MISIVIDKFKTLLKSPSVYLYLATIGGVLMGVCASVLNTHFLNPQEFGDYRYVTNIMQFAGSLLLFGFFTSGCRLLAITDDQIKRRRINGVMLIIMGIASAIIMTIMIVCSQVSIISKTQQVSQLFLIALPVCFAPLVLNYINTTFQGEKKIKELALARLLPYTLYLPLGYLIYSSRGATSTWMLLLVNGSAILVYAILILKLRPKFSDLKPEFRELAAENKSYGLHVYVGSVLAVSLSYLAGLTLGLFQENNENVGYYTLALTIVSPIMFLPSIVGTTHFREFATSNSIDKKIISRTVLLTIGSIILFIAVIPYIVDLLYPADYQIVGKYTVFLSIGMALHGMGDLFNRFLGAHGKGKEMRNGAIASGIVLVIGSFGLVYLFGIEGAISTRILASAIYFIMMLMYYRNIQKKLAEKK